MKKAINALLVDDEPGSLLTLETLLHSYCPDVNILASTGHPPEAITLIRNLKPEVVFLDIEMPYANAFDILDLLHPVSFEVVFITAFNNYALKAFKYAALDYLLKPVNIDELIVAVDRVKKMLAIPQATNKRVNTLLENLKNGKDLPEKISIPHANGIDLVNLVDICFIEAFGSYAHLFLVNAKKIVISRSLKELEDMLPPQSFVRVHHSFILNIRHVLRYIKKGRGGLVVMRNGENIEVSSRKRADFLEKFKI